MLADCRMMDGERGREAFWRNSDKSIFFSRLEHSWLGPASVEVTL
jgi:hypothetical protein